MEPFIGELQQFAFPFAPQGWAMCQGQLMPIRQYSALYAVIGVAYGGDGTTNFALPNLAGRFTMSRGYGRGLTPRSIGETGGAASVTLNQTQMPSHSHAPRASSTPGTKESPTNARWASPREGRVAEPGYAAPGQAVAMSPLAILPTGGGQPHENMPPYQALNWCIALQGIWPSRG